jgi:NAD+ synthase (glutamine-hydrolysing)
MDIANMTGGLVVGTGDLSELALGWATYNGDHMSMYAVNASVPKTMVRSIVSVYSLRDREEGGSCQEILDDILATPVSPELLPPKDGEIAQCTEAIVGPYELHDYFLYYMLAEERSPRRIYENAKYDFEGVYDNKTILGWLRVFVRRFFSQQFKRSCMPDGPSVTGISVSPRCGLAMPSDMSAAVWLKELDRIEEEEK